MVLNAKKSQLKERDIRILCIHYSNYVLHLYAGDLEEVSINVTVISVLSKTLEHRGLKKSQVNEEINEIKEISRGNWKEEKGTR